MISPASGTYCDIERPGLPRTLIAPGMWLIAYSLGGRASKTTALPVARMPRRSSVLISDVFWLGSSSVACTIVFTVSAPTGSSGMTHIAITTVKIGVLVFEPERPSSDCGRDADRPAAQYFGENTVSGVRCAISGRQCRHDQHQRQTAPQKPPHDPLLSRLWPHPARRNSTPTAQRSDPGSLHS